MPPVFTVPPASIVCSLHPLSTAARAVSTVPPAARAVRMPKFSPPKQCHRGPANKLHKTVASGSAEHVNAVLSGAPIDIDQGDEQGCSPLMIASGLGHSRIARTLINRGASISVKANDNTTALHLSAQPGHVAVSKILVSAGADLDAATYEQGFTPMHLAVQHGQLGVMGVLIEAGANVNSSSSDGRTPLYIGAENGRLNGVKMLLRANANPLLAATDTESGNGLKLTPFVPLDIAVQGGHSEVVRELVQQVGIEGCGGASGGVQALRIAAISQDLDIVAVLTDAGVVDTGEVLVAAAGYGCEASVKFLLRQKEGASSGRAAYVNFRDTFGFSSLLLATGWLGVSPPFPRIGRLLIDAGADTASAVQVGSSFNATPLAAATRMLHEKKIQGKNATEEQLHKLEGVRRLLLRVEAVHAVSFLWPGKSPSILNAAEGTRRTEMIATSLTRMLPLLRRRARRPRVILAALCRWVV